MLTLADLVRVGKDAGVQMKTLRQPGATRGGRVANYWYEVRMRDTKKEALRRVMFKEHHPIEKWIRVALGSLTLEGIPRGRYRLLERAEIDTLRRSLMPGAPGPHLRNGKIASP
jgi:16S rRNA U516 pseudouridylate synthase RsuA-like enzyme